MSAEKSEIALKSLHAAAAAAGLHIDYTGDAGLLNRPLRILLVSRDTAVAAPTSLWLRALCAEAQRAIREREVLVTGTGRIAYELPLMVSAEKNAPIVLLQKEGESPAVPLPSGSLQIVLKGRASDSDRDALLGAIAKTASCIAVRPGGNMAAIADSIRQRGGDIRSVSIDAKDPAPNEHWPKRVLTTRFGDWPYLTHYTREPDKGWPGESREDYLRWLSNPDSPPRNSFATLCRILEERRVRAARRLIRGGWPITCWTELAPDRVAELRGWRKGLRRWNFTPYGIAIHREALAELGARAVTYEDSETDPFTQTPRSGSYDWTEEREWRVLGDLDLSEVAKEKMLVLTATAREAEIVTKRFGLIARATEE